MPSRLELDIAWRYLRSRHGSKVLSLLSAIAVGGVVVGVSALIVVLGIMTGLQQTLREKMMIGSADIRVLGSNSAPIGDWQSVLGTVASQPGVVSAGPFVETQCVANAGHAYVEASTLIGLPLEPPNAGDVTDIRSHAVSGNFRFQASDGSRRGVVLGKVIADRLNVFVGDTVAVGCLGADTSDAVRAGGAVARRLEVTGIFDTGMYDFDGRHMYAGLPVAQELAAIGTAVSGIDARTRDHADAISVAKSLARIEPTYNVVDWQHENRSLVQAMGLEKLAMGVILCLVILVAAFNIVSNLTMLVVEKTREIGVLKAIGMTSRSVRRVFMTQGLAIGLAGTTAGLLLGVLVSLIIGRYELIKLDPEVYSIDHVPIATHAIDVAITIVVSITIAALATLYPSVQASRLVPIEAIRHD